MAWPRAHPRDFERLYKKEINRERTDITIQNSDTRSIGARQYFTKWLRRTRKLSRKSYESSWEATRSDTNTAQKSTHNNIACPSHTKYDNNNYARLPDTEIGGLTDLLRSSYSGNPLVRLSVRSLSRALITSFGRFPRSLATAQIPGADPSGSMQWSLSREGLIAPNWCEAPQTPRITWAVSTTHSAS